MEDSKKVEKTKKPTGKSATGKPLDIIDVNPQLNSVNKTNEAFNSLTASTLEEKKALTVMQRMQRARVMRTQERKLQRAREVAKKKQASQQKIQNRAMIAARNIVKQKFASRKGVPYAKLSTQEKIQIDKIVERKINLIKKIASRLLPKIRQAESERLKSFVNGERLKDQSTPNSKSQAIMPSLKNEQFDALFENLSHKDTNDLIAIIEQSIKQLNEQQNPMGKTLQSMLTSVLPKDPVSESLVKKSLKSGINYSTLREVYDRGYSDWDYTKIITKEQYAFQRVNSYIAKGYAYTLDSDLRENEHLNPELDSSFSVFLEQQEKQSKDPNKPSSRLRGTPSLTKIYKKDTPGQMSEEKICGTNCINCRYWDEKSKKPVSKDELNENGGLKAPDDNYLKMSKEVDLVTLPGKGTVTKKALCDNSKVNNYVTERMCCALWDGEGTKREYKGESPVFKESLDEAFNIQYASGIGITLTAEDLGMKIKGAFQYHPSVEEEMEEIEEVVKAGDKESIIIPSHYDQYGNLIPAKAIKRRTKHVIIPSGNVHDGEPDA